MPARLRRSFGFVLFLLLLAPWFLPVHAQEAPPPAEVEVGYAAGAMGVPAGGVDRGLRVLDDAGVIATVRPAAWTGWTGLTLQAYGLGNQGGDPSELVGDAQATSNIEAPNFWRLYEAWAQQHVGERASLLVGLYDVNSEFDVNRTGSLFLHSSHGIGALFGTSGRNGPSIFPVTSLGARLRVRTGASTYVQGAVLDGVPGCPRDPTSTIVAFRPGDGTLVAGEAGWVGGEGAGVSVDRTQGDGGTRKIAVGGWAYSGQLRDWDAGATATGAPVPREAGTWGVYLLAEDRLWREAEDQGLSAFLRLGVADETQNRFSRYLGAGAVYTGLLPARPSDRAGVAVAAVQNGDAAQAALEATAPGIRRREVNVEATYEAVLTPWLSVTGDVQYVHNPDTRTSIADAWVVGVRLAAGWGWAVDE